MSTTDTPAADTAPAPVNPLASVAQLRRLRPSGAFEPPACAVCLAAVADKVSDGTLADGTAAAFIPTCQRCYDARKAINP
jgi:hypothetical protein